MSKPIHILAIADNFVPERNAPALRMHEHCRRWVEQGASVTVITTVPNFPAGVIHAPYRNKFYQREKIDGIDVIRVWSYVAPNVGVVKRSLDFLSFATSATLAGLIQRPDVIIATSPQLLTGISAAAIAFFKRRPWVFEVRDLWPDSITAVGAMRHGPLITLLRRVEGFLYRSSTMVVTVSTALRDAIVEKNISSEKINVVPNGANMRRFAQSSAMPGRLEALNLGGKFVVGYVGTHGLAQGLETLVDAAEKLRDRQDIHFLMVGEGARRAAMIDLAKSRNLQNITFVGAVPAAQVSQYLAACNAIVVPLRRSSISPGAIPSKIFDAAAMARPIILAVDGISAKLIEEYDAGVVTEPENSEALAQAILDLKASPETCKRLGAGAQMIARDYDRERLADLMLEQIARLVRRPTS